MITRKGAGAAETRRFVWAGSRIAEEKDGQNNLVKRYFRQGVQVVSGDKPGLYYYTRDHLGSIRELTDATGAVRARYSYDLWGKRTKISGDIDTDFGYAGYWELENGLKLTWFRAYSPGLGRWLSRDKYNEEYIINSYSYVSNRPINYIDRKGEFAVPIIIGSAELITGVGIVVVMNLIGVVSVEYPILGEAIANPLAAYNTIADMSAILNGTMDIIRSCDNAGPSSDAINNPTVQADSPYYGPLPDNSDDDDSDDDDSGDGD